MKILQIIPAPKKLLYGYPDENNNVDLHRPVCLALVEHESGDREIKVASVGPNSSCIDVLDNDAFVIMED